jgi:hypothetical protein
MAHAYDAYDVVGYAFDGMAYCASCAHSEPLPEDACPIFEGEEADYTIECDECGDQILEGLKDRRAQDSRDLVDDCDWDVPAEPLETFDLSPAEEAAVDWVGTRYHWADAVQAALVVHDDETPERRATLSLDRDQCRAMAAAVELDSFGGHGFLPCLAACPLADWLIMILERYSDD